MFKDAYFCIQKVTKEKGSESKGQSVIYLFFMFFQRINHLIDVQ